VNSSFDFIVIGAGSAGCVVANRLSAAGAAVLLLEAGGADDWINIHIPAFIETLLDSPIDWGYRTVPQEHLLGRKVFLSRGKCLGGTSSINAMVYMRGNRGDYDHWRQLGNPGWGYDDVLPYFIKSETNQNHRDRYHGASGPLTVSSHNSGSVVHERFLAACAEAGLPYNPDVNGERQEGAGPFQATIGSKGCCSAAVAYLHPVSDRKNLKIVTNALVTKIILENSRAVGVEYLHFGERLAAHADGEIVLCGGAINSPQALMLSGIGPADRLKKAGIRPCHDLPGVGKNLQDHLQVISRFEVASPVTVFGISAAESDAATRQSIERGGGRFHTNFCEAGAFVRCDERSDYPDVQIHCESYFSALYYDGTPADRHGFGLIANVSQPLSRGEVRLHSADPLDRPVIDPCYLSEGEDAALTVKAVRKCLEIGNAKAFAAIGTRQVHPSPENGTDEGILDYIRRTASTIWHPAGTCKMGHDSMAVVDDRLRVRGLEGLRVADASIMPTIASGNINAPCIMIGEKAADLIVTG
jgi:choline dehydrogenase